ncbi:MAG: YesL family protein [Clostridia bacterium]|nr:YesL family protein [Clostridia bacterium]MBQ6327050.1 YesL family protein [Clostridia bacterium]MBQ8963735.1 YesL family protein [Clostridia bacterium]
MAIRDLMNNYFYGKQGKGDYTVADMPQNRLALFGEVLKVRWSGLFGVNLLYMVTWIPAIAWTFINVLALYNLLNAEAGVSGDDIIGLMNTWLMVMIPCIAITGPFNAGVTYVLRNWARDEHSFVLSDFKDALKANWKQALVISLIDGVMPFLVVTCWRFYSGMLSRSMIFILPAALTLLMGVTWTLASMLAYPMLITYELKTLDVIRNSVLMTVAKLPFALLIKLATLIVPALAYGLMALIPNIQMQVLMVVVLLYLTFMVAFNKLITVSYANWLFETYLNPRIEGARTNIGLRPENWDDVTYIPEDDEK